MPTEENAVEEKLVTIIFTEERVVQDEHRGTPRETRYKVGDTLECNEASADHWISRGVAYEISVGSKRDLEKAQAAVKKAAAEGEAPEHPAVKANREMKNPSQGEALDRTRLE